MNHSDKTLSILDKLISFKSVTPNGLDALEYIVEFLNKLDFKCEIKAFGSGDEKTYNLYAVKGDRSPNICFAGHVDVVPAMNEDLWQNDPYKMKIDGDKVFGRGTVDMKGAVACAMSVVEEFLVQHKDHKGSISFLLTTDEEGKAIYGLQKMLPYIKQQGHKIDLCILGEPTAINEVGDTAKIGRRGSVSLDLKVIGAQGHVAYPEKADNPLNYMVPIMNDLLNIELDEGSEFFQKSQLVVTSIDTGNNVTNIIPEFVTAKFNIRFNTNHTLESLLAQMEAIIKKYNIKYELQHHCSALPFIQEYNGLIKEFTSVIADECGANLAITTGGGTSDARFIHKYTKVVEFGLNCNLAHKIDEYTKISDLQKLCNVYYNSLVRFLKS